MQSWVKLCNSALGRVGARKINSLEETSSSAIACKAILENSLEEILALHPWNSARSRAVLALVGISGQDGHPKWPYKYAYSTPVDMLRAVRIEAGIPWGSPGAARPPVPYRLEMYQGERVLLCDEKSPDLIYVAKVTDPTVLSPELRAVIVAMLARELATTLVESSSKRAQFDAEFERTLNQAMYIDATQGYEAVPPDTTYNRERLINHVPGDF